MDGTIIFDKLSQLSNLEYEIFEKDTHKYNIIRYFNKIHSEKDNYILQIKELKYELEVKDEEIKIPPCPSKKDQKIGDFRNDKKLERVIGYERGQNGIECITLYEDVPFIDQYIPSFKQFTGVFSLALVGCSAPIILNLVKPVVKNVIKKLTKKKDKVE